MPRKNKNNGGWDWGWGRWGLVVLAYGALVSSTLSWGLPSSERVFSYFMDEWHSMTAIRSVFRAGTTMVEGSAFGTMFFYLVSGAWLGPWVLSGYLDTSGLVTEISEWWMYRRVLGVLRWSTLIWGIAALGLLYGIQRRWLGTKRIEALAWLAWSPIWLVTSGYFKYDVALVAGIAAAVAAVFWFGEKPTQTRWWLAGVAVGLASSIKLSGLPLVGMYVSSFWIYGRGKLRWKDLAWGLGIAGWVFLAVGVPDWWLGLGNYQKVVIANVIENPVRGGNYLVPWWWEEANWVVHFLTEWGGLGIMTVAGGVGAARIIKKGDVEPEMKKRLFVVLAGWGLMAMSLLPLHLSGLANRAMVLLPFAVLLTGWVWERWAKNKGWIPMGLLLLAGQGVWGVSWLALKWKEDPRVTASRWIDERVPSGAEIGLEPDPIYQWLPDNLWQEKAKETYEGEAPVRYRFVEANPMTPLPEWVVVSNYDLTEIEKESEKKKLVERLKREGYEEVKRFEPAIPLDGAYERMWKTRYIVKPKLVAMPRVIGVFKKMDYSYD